MNRPRRLRALGFATTLVLGAVTAAALAGCSDPTRSSSSLDQSDSPLYKLLGPISGTDGSKATRDRDRKIEELTAQCMKDKGFEYTPADRSTSAVPDADELAAQQTEEWVATNGYGFAGVEGGGDAGPKDPNQNYIDSLSESETQAYYEALNGKSVLTDEGYTTDTAYDPATAGCSTTAQREANGGKGNFWDDPKYTAVLEKASALYDKVEKAPSVKAVGKRWAESMAEAGYPDMKTKTDARDFVQQKNQELYGAASDGTTDGGDASAGPTAAELKTFRALEITVALADLRCDKKVGYSNEQLTVQFELENKFIQDNRAKLDELIDAYSEKK